MLKNEKERIVYKLVRVHMNELKVGDLFTIYDEGDDGPEKFKNIYRCQSNPNLFVEADIV